MGLDAALENFEFDVAIGVYGEDPSNLRVGAVVADDHVAARRELDIGEGIDRSGPQASVVGHVHEVDRKVIVTLHDRTSGHDLEGYPDAGPPGLGTGSSKHRLSRAIVTSLRSAGP